MNEQKITKDSMKNLQDFSKKINEVASELSLINEQFANIFKTASIGLNTFVALNNLLKFETIQDKFSDINSGFKNLDETIDKEINSSLKKFHTSFEKLSKVFKNSGVTGVIELMKSTLSDYSEALFKSIPDFEKPFENAFKRIGLTGRTTAVTLNQQWGGLLLPTLAPIKTVSAAIAGLSKVIFNAFSVTALGSIALFAGALAGIKAYYDRLMESNEEFRTKVNEAWAGVKSAFEPAIDAFGELFACLATGSETAGNSAASISASFLTVITNITSALSEAVSFIAEMISGVADFIKDIMFSTNEDASGNAVTTWQAISTAIGDAFAVIKEIFSVAAGVLSEIWDLFNEDVLAMFSSTWSTIAEVFSGVINTLSGLVGILTGIFTGNWEKVGDSFKKVVNGIKNVFSSLLDFIKNILGNIGSMIASAIGGVFDSTLGPIINKASDLLGKLFVKSGTSGISSISSALGSAAKALKTSVGIPKLAAGGLVDPGQFFVAREAGPELVGSFGARTAVMNNNQIVDAVSAGVYKAVKEAMGFHRISSQGFI